MFLAGLIFFQEDCLATRQDSRASPLRKEHLFAARIIVAIDGLQVEQGEKGLPPGAALCDRNSDGGGLVALSAEQSLAKCLRVLLRGLAKK